MSAPRTTVYFDGACPLCRREISLLQKMDRKERLLFRDISSPQAAAFCPLPQERMLAQFHVRRADGVMMVGAAAFLTAYSHITGLGWLDWFRRSKYACGLLDHVYRLFLKVRPRFQRMARRLEGTGTDH